VTDMNEFTTEDTEVTEGNGTSLGGPPAVLPSSSASSASSVVKLSSCSELGA